MSHKIESIIFKKYPIFSIDKIRIVSKKSKAQLKCRLPLRKLAEFSKRTQMDYVDGKGGYKSRIEAERPEIGWFEILNNFDKSGCGNKLGVYKISLLELAYDWEMPSYEMAMKEGRNIAKIYRKLYRRSDEPVKVKEDYQKENNELPHRYFYAAFEQEQKDCVVVIYSRKSKLNGLPIVKIEWRLKSASTINTYTNISNISDFKNFSNKNFFDTNFILEEINYEELGKWLAPTKYKSRKIGNFTYNPRIGYIFCRVLKIFNSADLRAYFKKRKNELSRKRGRQTKFQNKIKQLSPYKLNKFFIRKKNSLLY